MEGTRGTEAPGLYSIPAPLSGPKVWQRGFCISIWRWQVPRAERHLPEPAHSVGPARRTGPGGRSRYSICTPLRIASVSAAIADQGYPAKVILGIHLDLEEASALRRTVAGFG